MLPAEFVSHLIWSGGIDGNLIPQCQPWGVPANGRVTADVTAGRVTLVPAWPHILFLYTEISQ